jgi:hypothetical protein
VYFTDIPQRVEEAVLAGTSRDAETDSALGQIIKSVSVGEHRHADFCSKWFFETPQGLVATRDVSKLLLTKQYYNRSNALMYNDPFLHREAILYGVKSE